MPATPTTTPATDYAIGGINPRFIVGDVTTLDRPEVTSPERAADALRDLPWPTDREACFRLDLDTKHRLIQAEMVSIGSVNHTFMAPREVFRGALLAGSSAIVLAHNHPSGDPSPSRDDEQVAMLLSRAGEMLGVDVLDALVVAGTGPSMGWTSLARRGVI